MGSFITFLGIKDRFGTNIGSYEIQYDPGLFDMVGNGIALIISLIYSTLVQPVGGLASGVIGVVANPSSFLGTLEKGYEFLLEPLTKIVDPRLVGLAVASVAMLILFFKKSTVMSQTRGKVVEATLSSYFLVVFATYLALNPFRPLRVVFSTTNSIVSDVTRGLAATSADGTLSAEYLTRVTQLINFGSLLNDETSARWSRTLARGGEIKDIPGVKDVIEHVSPGSVFTALSAGTASLAMLVFAVVALAFMFYYVWELTWRVVVVPVFMYYSAMNFRRVDLMWETLGRIVVYVFMCALVSLFAVGAPIMATGVIADIFGNKSAFLQIFTSIIVYVLLTWLMTKIFSPTGRFAEAMRLHGRNQWRGYMQRSSILLASDKVTGLASKALDLTDKASRAALAAYTGVVVPESVPTPVTALKSQVDKHAGRAGERIPFDAKRLDKDDDMNSEAMSTVFDSAPKSATIARVAPKALTAGTSTQDASAGAPGGASPGAKSGGSGASSKVGSAVAALSSVAALKGGSSSAAAAAAGGAASGGVAGAAGKSGATAGVGKAALSLPAGSSGGGVADVVEGELVDDAGVINSLNFPKPGDVEGVARYQELSGSVGLSAPESGVSGSAVMGSSPAHRGGLDVVDAEVVEDADIDPVGRMHEAASQVLFYRQGVDGVTQGVVDPRVPVDESFADKAREQNVVGAQEQELADVDLPPGVEVFGGSPVWVDPSGEEMVYASPPVTGLEDTVTVEGMREYAEAIEDPQLREVFVSRHRLDVVEVGAGVPGGVRTVESAAESAVKVPPVADVGGADAVETVGDMRVMDRGGSAAESMAVPSAGRAVRDEAGVVAGESVGNIGGVVEDDVEQLGSQRYSTVMDSAESSVRPNADVSAGMTDSGAGPSVATPVSDSVSGDVSGSAGEGIEATVDDAAGRHRREDVVSEPVVDRGGEFAQKSAQVDSGEHVPSGVDDSQGWAQPQAQPQQPQAQEQPQQSEAQPQQPQREVREDPRRVQATDPGLHERDVKAERKDTPAPRADASNSGAQALSVRTVRPEMSRRLKEQARREAEATRFAAERAARAVKVEVAEPVHEERPARRVTPKDFTADLEVMDRRDGAGRAGSSVSMTGRGTGSADISYSAPVVSLPHFDTVASLSVMDSTFEATHETCTQQSQLVSSAMGTGGVSFVPYDDPSLDDSFEVVDGVNVVSMSGGFDGF